MYLITIEMARTRVAERMRAAEGARVRHEARTAATSEPHAIVRRQTA